MPVVIGAGGVERVIELNLNKAEQTMLKKSVASVRGLVDACKALQKKAGAKAKPAKKKSR